MQLGNEKVDSVLETLRCYAQREEDRVLDALVRKTEVIRQELGALKAILMRPWLKLTSTASAARWAG